MSNDLINIHVEDGEPFGSDLGIIEIADCYADVIRQLRAELETIESKTAEKCAEIAKNSECDSYTCYAGNSVSDAIRKHFKLGGE